MTHRSSKVRLEFVDTFVSIFKRVWRPMCVVLFRTGLKYLIVINVWVGSQKPTQGLCTGRGHAQKKSVHMKVATIEVVTEKVV